MFPWSEVSQGAFEMFSSKVEGDGVLNLGLCQKKKKKSDRNGNSKWFEGKVGIETLGHLTKTQSKSSSGV